jgi:hypothetical protein
MTNPYNLTFAYNSGSNLFAKINEICNALPPKSNVLSSWSKKNNTLSTTISNLSSEDLLMLKLKFNIVKVEEVPAHEQTNH